MFKRIVIPLIVFALIASGCGPATTNDAISPAPVPEAPTQVEETVVKQPQDTSTKPTITVPDGIPTAPLQNLPDGTPVVPTHHDQDGEVEVWSLTEKEVSVSDIFRTQSPGLLFGEVLTLSACDGPLPVGDIVALVLIAGTLYYVVLSQLQPIEFTAWQYPASSTSTITMEIPASHVQTAEEVKPREGASTGIDSSAQYSTSSWTILSITYMCTMHFRLTLPNNDWSKLLDVETENKLDRSCNVFDIIGEMLKLGKKALDAGGRIEFIKLFYEKVFTRLVNDMKLPFSGDYIVKMLGL